MVNKVSENRERRRSGKECTRKKLIHEELPNNSETEDMRKIQ